MTRSRRQRDRRAMRAELHNAPWLIEPATYQMLLDVADSNMGLDEARDALGMGNDDECEMEIVNGVAYLPIRGLIMPENNVWTRWFGATSCAQIEHDLRLALSNDQVREIVLMVNSPGGMIFGVPEAANAIYAARGQKPIKAFVRGQGASAAYWLASAADEIYATPSSALPSCGVILVLVEYAEQLKELGIGVNIITYGEFKSGGHPAQKLSDKHRQEFVDRVTDSGKLFDAAVARHRGISPETVHSTYGQGAVFNAGRCLELAIIDHLVDSVADVTRSESSTTTQGTASAVVSTPAAEAATPPMEPVMKLKNVTAKVKAALVLIGAIRSHEATIEECSAILVGMAAVKGTPLSEDSSESDLVALAGPLASATATAPPAAGNPPAPSPSGTSESGTGSGSDNVSEAHRQEMGEAAAAERNANIRRMGQTFGVSQAEIDAAIDATDTPWHTFAKKWSDAQAKDRPPVNTNIEPTESEVEKFNAGAIDGIMLRCGLDVDEPSPHAASLSSASFVSIARKALQLAGRPVNEFAMDQDVAVEFLQMGGIENRNITAAAGPPQTTGSFPHLLSALVNKVLDQGLDLDEVTYREWTHKIADLPDFKPATIISNAQFDELDIVGEGKDAPEIEMSEELTGFIAAEMYGNTVKLTPQMIANDDLDGFAMQIMSLGHAWENTLNRLCVGLIGNNDNLLDGTALFHSTRGNLVSSGGAPSHAQMSEHRRLHRTQTGVGGTGKIKTPPAIALVPTNHETAAEQLLLPYPAHHPDTDANKNIFAGKLQVICEPELDNYDSGNAWYTFARAQLRRVIVHAFLKGYGPRGRRETWYEPKNSCRNYKLSGGLAAAAVGGRGAVKNPGS